MKNQVIRPSSSHCRWHFFASLLALASLEQPSVWAGSHSSVSGVVTVDTRALEIVGNPTNLTVWQCTGGAFSVSVLGAQPRSYQWRLNGYKLPAGTNQSLILSNVQPADAGDYSLAITNVVGGVVSSNATLTVRKVIRTEPQSQSVPPGDDATFSVSITGPYQPTYQWQFNGTNIPNATAATLKVSNVQPVNAGAYRVRLNYSTGSTYSSNASLTVLPLSWAINANGSPQWVWTTANWFGQTQVSRDWIGAAQSGPTADWGSSTMETTIAGPGVATFWWKVSSEAGYDFLTFFTNGVAVARISGEIDWQFMTVNLAPGSQTLRFTYRKDASFADGADAAWVDTFQASAAIRPPTLRTLSIVKLADGGCRLLFGDIQGPPLESEDVAKFALRTSTNLVDWVSQPNSLSVTNGLLFFDDVESLSQPQKFYQIIER